MGNGREKGVEDRVRLAMAPNAIGHSRSNTHKQNSSADFLGQHVNFFTHTDVYANLRNFFPQIKLFSNKDLAINSL